MKVIALEEHYWDRELAGHFKERGPEMRIPALQERLFDLGALRLKEMDEAGIDVQVLSHGAPATQRPRTADCRSARAARQRPARRSHQGESRPVRRFRRPAHAEPKAAADELSER